MEYREPSLDDHEKLARGAGNHESEGIAKQKKQKKNPIGVQKRINMVALQCPGLRNRAVVWNRWVQHSDFSDFSWHCSPI